MGFSECYKIPHAVCRGRAFQGLLPYAFPSLKVSAMRFRWHGAIQCCTIIGVVSATVSSTGNHPVCRALEDCRSGQRAPPAKYACRSGGGEVECYATGVALVLLEQPVGQSHASDEEQEMFGGNLRNFETVRIIFTDSYYFFTRKS